MTGKDYDLVVIGSGPAGQKAAINAAKLGKRVAVIERAGMVGGVSVHSGTIPSKTARDAVLYLTGFNERAFYGQDYRLREQIKREEIDSRVPGKGAIQPPKRRSGCSRGYGLMNPGPRW